MFKATEMQMCVSKRMMPAVWCSFVQNNLVSTTEWQMLCEVLTEICDGSTQPHFVGGNAALAVCHETMNHPDKPLLLQS